MVKSNKTITSDKNFMWIEFKSRKGKTIGLCRIRDQMNIISV